MVGPQREAVVLLHGLAAHRVVMSRLSTALHRQGYRVTNWGYPSIRLPIERHAQQLANYIDDLEASGQIDRFHLVTHSMGSIITRVAVMDTKLAKLGRIVMLGPPNHGSHVARRLAGPLGWLCPALPQLSDGEDSFVNRLPQPEQLELGVIAAAQDLVVPRPSTTLSCQRDWILLPGHHGVLPWRTETARQVLYFLQHGRFAHQSNGSDAGVS